MASFARRGRSEATMTRRRYITVGLAVVVLIAGALWWLAVTSSLINRHSYELIRDGMTRSAVEELLGGPARDELIEGRWPSHPADANGRAWSFWQSSQSVIGVQFDQDDHVTKKSLHPSDDALRQVSERRWRLFWKRMGIR